MAKKKKDVEEEAKPETSDGSIAANDAWTGMLAVSFLALAIGAGFLFYDWYFLYPETEPPKVSKFVSTLPGAPQKEKGPQPKDGKEKEKEKEKDKDKEPDKKGE